MKRKPAKAEEHRGAWIPYGRQSMDDEDIRYVVKALRSDWLTTGPLVDEFEQAFSRWTGAREAVAVSSGTAALHAAMYAAGIGAGDEVIVPAMTFVATANSVLYQGGTPVFADVDPNSLLINPGDAESRITSRTKAIVTVDFAGQPCDYPSFRKIARKHNLLLIADSCHALGAEHAGKKTGTLADLTVFSFHPVKHITTGEGGMIATDDAEMARRMRLFRNHGIASDHRQRASQNTWFYEMVDLGFNYRITDIQCALGLSQLGKLPQWLERRRKIARRYDEAFADMPVLKPLAVSDAVLHAYHLYVVRYTADAPGMDRDEFFSRMRREGIGVNVHYIPVPCHPYYRIKFGYRQGDFPSAEAAYKQIVSLPMFPAMSDGDVDRVIAAVHKITGQVPQLQP
ncbi:MAG: UDP-4-amino-4,6-dideoxy-N-acetyl-beta-L-altrosamine transaminase [Syntrophales bacterium]